MADAKPILTSRTFWANIVAALALLAPVVFTQLEVVDADTQATITGAIVVVMNLVLRLLTSTPVTLIARRRQ